MQKAKTPVRWFGILITVAVISILIKSPGVFGVGTALKEPPQPRADIIRIDSLKVFGKLERPPVTFLHEKHTEALAKKNKDCSACHPSAKDPLSGKERMSLQFMRLKDTSKQEGMDVYHVNCIGCHRETKAAKEKSGPVECGNCHYDNPAVVSVRQTIGMDKSLHYRHAKAQDDKCEQCHHEYNEVTQQLFYEKGKEGTCRYCHKQVTEQKVSSFGSAAHTGCIDCHRRTLAKNQNTGPFDCQGCHDPAQQKRIKEVEAVPRMKMNQPNMVLIKTANPESSTSEDVVRMQRVPFNHEVHEASNDTCRICHHAALTSCVQCHTREGTKKGDFVTLEQSMHRSNAEQSCLGCHGINQNDQRCAGCHASIPASRQNNPTRCGNCHMAPLQANPGEELTAEERILRETEMAAALLNSRISTSETYADEDIPETVEIKRLMNLYEPAKLPHRKIVQTLVKNIKNDKLANYFHTEKGTVCQGCHHYSPADQKPPACESCHGIPFNENDPFKPGLMAAYHRQCMECHREMGLEKPAATDCTACHRPKG
jgi:hypothetical protein